MPCDLFDGRDAQHPGVCSDTRCGHANRIRVLQRRKPILAPHASTPHDANFRDRAVRTERRPVALPLRRELALHYVARSAGERRLRNLAIHCRECFTDGRRECGESIWCEARDAETTSATSACIDSPGRIVGVVCAPRKPPKPPKLWPPPKTPKFTEQKDKPGNKRFHPFIIESAGA